MNTSENFDLINSVVGELGRLSLLVEALQASHRSLQAQVDTLKNQVVALEQEPTAWALARRHSLTVKAGPTTA